MTDTGLSGLGHIAELDLRLSDSSKVSLRAQSKLYDEIARICVLQPKCKVFQAWGFTDRDSSIPSFFREWIGHCGRMRTTEEASV